MTTTTAPPTLRQRLGAVRACLTASAGIETAPASGEAEAPASSGPSASGVAGSGGAVPAVALEDGLARIVRLAGLTPFERDLLVLVAGCELDPGLPALCATANADSGRPFPTLALAMSALPGSHWDALVSTAPLRSLGLIRMDESAQTLMAARLSMDEPVLFALLGLDDEDERLLDLAEREVPRAVPLARSHADALALALASWNSGDARAIAVVSGSVPDRRAFENALAAAVGARRLWRIRAADPALLSTATSLVGGERRAVFRRLLREIQLAGSVVVFDLDDADPGQLLAAIGLASRLIDATSRVVVSSAEATSGLPATIRTVELADADLGERIELWESALGPAAVEIPRDVQRLAGQFRLGADQIEAVVADVRDENASDVPSALWRASRLRSRVNLDGLAERIQPSARWDDLVLPERESAALRDLLRHTRFRSTVFEQWRLTGSDRRGAGVTALFAGPSGTGKSLAAEVIAAELHVDLYRLDLSQVVSKYIGETEKNLRRVFDTAERSGAVLVIDEADALLGQRTAVKDSHDRYANIEVSYLLQRMETYRGLAVLTTNLRSNIDDAFVRRLGFIVTFPFPDLQQRLQLWERAFGPRVPQAHLHARSLAQLTLSGGSIRNVAVNAAFLAAERGDAVTMLDVLRGARSEYGKLDRPLTSTEIEGWPG